VTEVHLVTDPAEMQAVYRIRHDVFVCEQKVPLELERDEDDEVADHFLATAGDARTPAGAGRLVAEPGGVAHLGRLAVLPAYRGTGLGVALVRAIEQRAAEHGLRVVELAAQTHALRFYERLGYEAFGEEFDDAGLPHRHMHKTLEGS
jgi:predicted GNAT family N-acyltransferase